MWSFIFTAIGMVIAGCVGAAIRAAIYEPKLPPPPITDESFSMAVCGVEKPSPVAIEDPNIKITHDLLRVCLKGIEKGINEIRIELDTHRRPGHQKIILDKIDNDLNKAVDILMNRAISKDNPESHVG